MSKYENAPEVEALASVLIAESLGSWELPSLEDCQEAKIKYLFKLSDKSGGYLGKCSKATGKWQHLTGMDYVIEIWKPFWDFSDDNQKKALIYHELRHIWRTEKEKDGKVKVDWKIRKHDVELFIDELRLFGEWRRELVELKTVYEKKEV